ncbi:MAG: gfo/Idh/MocA family oxidoreductase [Planctomycetota bacterium]|nr:MAG: gfo/Idh/MocA family oxidoreductase [Planctomycetota bacterium]REJ92980.1 MAG: gfo/Idh/MocA family oxidoreductase [Planctomycetota bacterium]REK30590.1 MAG: gfo/Idh/MocA family oxidoreductase [Planctomycetota bacterium]REK46014.1 MAG: gfo/Idh/MocA family oxidoreductase [Planctomycetota bacterium]
MKQANHADVSRRKFLSHGAKVAALGAAVPYFFTGQQAAAIDDKSQSPSDRLRVALIGCGGQGNWDTARLLRWGDVIALCDVDSKRPAASMKFFGDTTQKYKIDAKFDADVYEDYRHVLDRKDVDVVVIGTPDHWHTKPAIEAMQAGKDVYCEKPLTLTIDEGKQIRKVLEETGRVFQVGTQQRSEGPFIKEAGAPTFLAAVALCREGRLGKIKKISVAIGGAPSCPPQPVVEVPANLNWDMWLGQAPLVDYRSLRCHYQFRWWYEYSGGKMTDWGAHHVDIAHWALGADDTGPVEVMGLAQHPVPFENGYPLADDRYNAATAFHVVCKFKDGVELHIHDGDSTRKLDNGVLIEGDKGRIFVNRGRLTGKPVEELKDNPLPEGAIQRAYNGMEPTSHAKNFVDCLKSRRQPISDMPSHHRAMTTCHLANIAIRLGRKIQWDPATELVVGDDAEMLNEQWLKREQRAGYEIPG